ncbi:MAG: PA0069 family radical SAM protein [Burkholderiaceae bacterium]|nr:PA0069 family radical SAM protein [Burkholderiaceae bacterium]
MEKPVLIPPLSATKGRGSLSNERSRFEAWRREAQYEDLDPEEVLDTLAHKPKTTVWLKQAKNIISTNQSPDLPFDASVNPYQGCEHGCIYCYARPSHAYLGLSPGLDFETKLFAKQNAATLLEKELSARHYIPKTIVLGANTDPYQPIERTYKLTRSILEVLERYQHPLSITTKSGLVMHDIDILERMARKGLVRVLVSVTSLQNDIARTLEPRASAPARRLEAVRRLAEAGIPVGVLVAPIIPAITDMELEAIVARAAEAGASYAAYTLLRLPREVEDLFAEWLQAHFPLRAKHVMSLLMQMRGGKAYDAAFGHRMKGTGIFAELIRNRFHLARKRNGIDNERFTPRTDLFAVPRNQPQLDLF